MVNLRLSRVRRGTPRFVAAVALVLFAAGGTLNPVSAQEPDGVAGWDELGEIDQLLVAAMARLERVSTQPEAQTVVEGSTAPEPGVQIAAQSGIVVPSSAAVTAENFGRFTKDAFVSFPQNQDFYEPSVERVGLLFELSGSLAEQPGQIELAVFYGVPGLATYAPLPPLNTPDQQSSHVSAVVSLDGEYRTLSTQAAFPGSEFGSPHLIVVFTAPSPADPSVQSTFVFFVLERADGAFHPTITSAIDRSDPNAYIWRQYDFAAPIATTLIAECEREEVAAALRILNGDVAAPGAPTPEDDPVPENPVPENPVPEDPVTETETETETETGGSDGGSGWVAPVAGVAAVGATAEGVRRVLVARRKGDAGRPPVAKKTRKAGGAVRKRGRRVANPPPYLQLDGILDDIETNEATTIGGAGYVRLSATDARDAVYRRVAELSEARGAPLDENDFYIPSREIWNQALDEATADGADVEDLRRQVDYSFDQSVEPPAIITPVDRGQSALLYPSPGQSAPDSGVPVLPGVKIGVESNGRRAFWQGSGGGQSGVVLQ